jgi:hypothetical protein
MPTLQGYCDTRECTPVDQGVVPGLMPKRALSTRTFSPLYPLPKLIPQPASCFLVFFFFLP